MKDPKQIEDAKKRAKIGLLSYFTQIHGVFAFLGYPHSWNLFFNAVPWKKCENSERITPFTEICFLAATLHSYTKHSLVKKWMKIVEYFG